MAIEWLRLCDSSAGGVCLIPGGETKIPHATRRNQKKILHLKVSSQYKVLTMNQRNGTLPAFTCFDKPVTI